MWLTRVLSAVDTFLLNMQNKTNFHFSALDQCVFYMTGTNLVEHRPLLQPFRDFALT